MKRTNDDLERKLAELFAQVPPPPNDLAAGRERMLAEATRLKARTTSHALSPDKAIGTQKPQRRRKVKMYLAYRVLAAVMAVVVGTAAAGGGVAFASADSLPGETLYPAKTFFEDARLSLTADPAALAELNLAFAAERAAEMDQLKGQGEAVPQGAIERMARHTRQYMQQIAQAQPEEVPGLLERAMETARTQEHALEKAGQGAPEGVQPALRQAKAEAKRAYETASAGQGDPQRFQNEYQTRYWEEVTPGSPDGPKTPQQHQNGEGNTSPMATPQQNQWQGEHTPEPGGNGNGQDGTPGGPYNEERNQNENQNTTPSGEGIHQRDQDRDQDRTQPDPDPNLDQQKNWNRRNQTPTPTPDPSATPDPSITPETTVTPQTGQGDPAGPGPSDSPGHNGEGKGH
jgi:hypothetical protein